MGKDRESNEQDSSDRKQRQEEINVYDLEFSIRKSVRYHAKRRRHFEILHHWSVVLTSIAGTSAVTALLGDLNTFALVLTSASAIISITDSIVDFSGKQKIYNDLQRKFSELLAKIIEAKKTAENLASWEAERIMIEIDEPTQLSLLNCICHNEQKESEGEKIIYKFSKWRSMVSQFSSFDSHVSEIYSKTKETPKSAQ